MKKPETTKDSSLSVEKDVNTTPQDTNAVNKENQVKAGDSRAIKGRFVKGKSGNPKGLTPRTPEQKLEKKAEKIALEQRVTEYKEKLGDALPLISPVLIKKAVKGDIQAIKEISATVIPKEASKVDVIVKGAIAHGHFHPEDDKVKAEIEAAFNSKYKENMHDRIKELPVKENKDE